MQSIKHVLNRLVEEEPSLSAAEALAETTRVLNNREVVRGFSPIQYILGRAPDECGRFFSTVAKLSPELLDSDAQQQETAFKRRVTAEKAFLDWQAQQRLSRATRSKHRRRLNFSAGGMVYIWRQQLTGEDAKQNKIGAGRFVGPARILATEKKRDEHGNLVPGSSVWLVRGRRLLKGCPEQMRHATEREITVELQGGEHLPRWDFPRIAEELGGNEYDDFSE